MSRKALEVDQNKLSARIAELEGQRTFTSHNELFQILAPEFNVAPIILRNRVELWGIQLKTQKGRRGRKAGQIIQKFTKTDRTKRANSSLLKDLARMNQQHMLENDGRPIGGYDKKIEGIKKGHVKSLIWAKCMQCSCGQKDEIKHCQVKDCALFGIRPYGRIALNMAAL